MLETDLTIKSTDGRTVLGFESKKAKDNFLRDIRGMTDKSNLIKTKGYTCGGCAAYPCFRSVLENAPAGLCYQEIRECRQECNDFVQIKGSGKSPEFQIRGNCKRDNAIVNYDAKCRFLDEK